jgi:ABC-type phosphate transport system auxiliary subunit
LKTRDELLELYANHFSGQHTLTNAALTKVEAAGTALEIALRKERDGSEVAPKKKSLQNRLQDVQDIREKIVEAKKKMEEKCGQRLITNSAVLEALRVHDEEQLNKMNKLKKHKAECMCVQNKIQQTRHFASIYFVQFHYDDLHMRTARHREH